MSIKQLIDAQKGNLALLVGNGINRHGNLANTNSWSDLLIALAKKHIDPSTRHIPTGVSLTEFYDLLELADDSTGTSRLLQEEFCAPMRKWIPDTHHKAITKWAIAAGCPILTTNFDRVLSLAANARLFSLPGLRFTDYYPWNTYFGLEQLDRPTTGFGIWHVNGTINYRRSIRLGLTHYMGSVARARAWLHRRDASGLFRGRDANGWSGSSTWLHIIFNRPMLIFGLSLEENEVFLRWLLIERAKYFKKFPNLRQECWYADVGKVSSGKSYFLESVGIRLLRVHSFDEIYSHRVWA